MSATFLDESEIAEFTGRKSKSKQIEALREMGIAFFVNAAKKPVVPRHVIEGRKEQQQQQQVKWEMPRHGKKAK